MASIYVHIPFCQSRCIYCDFFSTTDIPQQLRYVERLEQEMLNRSKEWASHARTYSIYIGGGTPSTLPPALIQRLLDSITRLYPIEASTEITIEANPNDITPAFVQALRQTPVNRISMGVQTFNDDTLRLIRRRHTAEQAIHAVRLLQDAGYTNLSIDLIYGLPNQTLDDWRTNLQKAFELDIAHLSAYSLMYEEGTALTRMLERGEISEMSEDDSIACYELLCTMMRDHGYEHYEISNFARPGMHSRHNTAYWMGEPYLGFGAGAHSYDGKSVRRWNSDSLSKYINSTDSFETEILSHTDLYNEFVMTRLRTSKGFLLSELEHRFGLKALHHCTEMAQPHLQSGHLMLENSRLHLTEEGVFVSNDVISDLFL